MCGSMVDIQSVAAEIRQGIKKDRKKPQGKNVMSASATQGGRKSDMHILLKYAKKSGNMRMWQSHIRIKLTCLS